MNTLYAGYWTGEFGWELMRWQAIIRHAAKKFDRVVVGCMRDKRYLYQDFATEYRDIDINNNSRNMWMANGMVNRIIADDGDYSNVIIVPNRDVCLGGPHKSDFLRYGTKSMHGYDILIHARSTDNCSTGYRNYSLYHWSNIVSHCLGNNLSVCSVGKPGQALHIPNTTNLLGIPLSELADVMSSSIALLSPSSGVAHFACLCRLPHVVWSDTRLHATIGGTNKVRYERVWNPFNTECKFIGSWQPDYKQVLDKMYELL